MVGPPFDQPVLEPGRASDVEYRSAIRFSDIASLFTDSDVSCMDGLVQLRDYAFMSDPAGDGEFASHVVACLVLKQLTLPNGSRRMPKNRPPWLAEQIALFEQWIDDGFLP